MSLYRLLSVVDQKVQVLAWLFRLELDAGIAGCKRGKA